MWRELGTDSFLARPERKMYHVGFVGEGMEMVIFFGSVPSTLFCMFRELPEFVSLMSMDRSEWPRCMLWHGWLPGVSSTGGRNPWAASFGQVACFELERGQGAYPVDESAFWTAPDHWDADDIALEMTDAPNIWRDGSREVCFLPLVGLRSLGLGVYLPASEIAFEGAVCGVAEE